MTNWLIFRGATEPHDGIRRLPPPPPWRQACLQADADEQRGRAFRATSEQIDIINAALYLRRPLLVGGPPGSGKSSLAYAVAWELRLGAVLHWHINSRSTREVGLYGYDAMGRLADLKEESEDGRPGAGTDNSDIGRYFVLGPLGTALATSRADRPRVLLIDEIDKSDVDLPNDLLDVLEQPSFVIPELARVAGRSELVHVRTWDRGPEGQEHELTVPVKGGRVTAQGFPFVVITTNNERDLPLAFLRRCLRLEIGRQSADELREIVRSHLASAGGDSFEKLLKDVHDRRERGDLIAIDQLLNTVFMLLQAEIPDETKRKDLQQALLRSLDGQ